MNRSKIRFVAATLVLFLLICVAGSIRTALTAGQAKEFVQLRVGSITENLKALKGSVVTVTFPGGGQMTGTVKNVDQGILHLEKLSQKDFYDAVVLVEHIIAIEARVR